MFVRGPQIKHHLHLPGDRCGTVGIDIDPSDRGDEVPVILRGNAAGNIACCDDDVACRDKRILAVLHSGRAAVAGAARDGNGISADAGDIGNNADIDLISFQSARLFDMQLKAGQD